MHCGTFSAQIIVVVVVVVVVVAVVVFKYTI
jgi:hypothetical protein